MTRIKGIDGLRAIAVLTVFAYHGTGYMPGGWVGVDVFFVISGFVITRMLKHEYDATGRLDLPQFYIRRLLRLWPALLVMVGFFTIAFGLPATEWLPTVTYTANFTRMVDSGFDPIYPWFFGHTWSLAVEEQFYLIWPLALIFIFRTRNPVFWIINLALVTCIWRLVMILQDGDQFWRMFNGLDTRADALMIGSALAFSTPAALARLWPIGVAFLVWMTQVPLTTSWVYMLGFPLIALSAASVIAKVCNSQDGILTRLLDLPPLKGLGVISYSVYLWHFPTLWFFGQFGVLFCLVLSIALSVVSWFLIERPIRRNRDRIIAHRGMRHKVA